MKKNTAKILFHIALHLGVIAIIMQLGYSFWLAILPSVAAWLYCIVVFGIAIVRVLDDDVNHDR